MTFRKKLKKLFRGNFIPRSIYLLVATVICIGVIMLVVFVVNILIPFLRVVDFLQTTCTANLSRYENNVDCVTNCDKSKSSKFPCIQVYAIYKDRKNVSRNALLHENEYNLFDYPTCSYSACARYEWENQQNVKKFEDQYGIPKKKYSCWYSASNPKLLIVTREHSPDVVMHFLLWPSLGVFIGAIIILVMYCVVGCDIWGPRIATVMWEKSLKRMEMEQEIKKRTVRHGHDNEGFNEF